MNKANRYPTTIELALHHRPSAANNRICYVSLGTTRLAEIEILDTETEPHHRFWRVKGSPRLWTSLDDALDFVTANMQNSLQSLGTIK